MSGTGEVKFDTERMKRKLMCMSKGNHMGQQNERWRDGQNREEQGRTPGLSSICIPSHAVSPAVSAMLLRDVVVSQGPVQCSEERGGKGDGTRTGRAERVRKGQGTQLT